MALFDFFTWLFKAAFGIDLPWGWAYLLSYGVLILIMVLAVSLHWLPVSGSESWANFVMPTITLGYYIAPVFMRLVRAGMIEVLASDYVRTARAKGLSPARVIGVHALRNALLPVVTVIGLSVSGLMAGAVLTETIFSWPGVGHWLIDSIGRRDYPALQGGVLLISAVVVLVNLIVDLVYGIIDPRISHGR